jgi:SAM-dependent methyltransferase
LRTFNSFPENMSKSKEWFGEWFDSPYYHILYKHRDFEEAAAFVDKLAEFFNFQPQDKIIDLACGKGRHSVRLNEKGLDVTGLDLSPQNIEAARQHENEHLHFYVHDMREVFVEDKFDYVLNMFTSFGYFATEQENQQAIIAAARALKPGGKLMIDFLNPELVINRLVPQEEKTIEGIRFKINKELENGYIVKDIRFEDHEGKMHHHQERVKAIMQQEFEAYFRNAGLKVLNIFGDYGLNTFDPSQSERMIFVTQK